MNGKENIPSEITTSHDNSKLAALHPPEILRNTTSSTIHTLFPNHDISVSSYVIPCRVHDYIIIKLSPSSRRSRCPVERAKQPVGRQGQKRPVPNLKSLTVQRLVYKYVMMFGVVCCCCFGLLAVTCRLVVCLGSNASLSKRINIRDHASRICFSIGFIICRT